MLVLLLSASLVLVIAKTLFSATEPGEDLPVLLEETPHHPFDILSPVNAGKKTIPEAREQLQREAKKVQADAVVSVRCEPGGMHRDGLTWYNQDASCRGIAIRFQKKP
jgi:hypothetical protein